MSLIAKEYFQVVHRYRPSDGGQDNNGYDFSGLIDAINRQLQQHAPIPIAPPAGTGVGAPGAGASGARPS